MQRAVRIIVVAALLALPALGEMRTWTSTSGSTIEAEYIRLDGQNVVLKSGGGEMFRIGVTLLSDEDQAYVRARQTPAMPAASLPAASARDEPDLLTDDEIASLKTEVDVRSDHKYRFTGSFGPKRLDAREQRRLRADSPIVYRITADFNELRQGRGGRWSGRRIGTRVQFYVLDADGNVLVNRSEPLANLCPT